MITFDIITIFPRFFDSFLGESIIKRAQGKKLIRIRVFDLRDWAKDKHRTVDDRPFGGGRGMVLKLEPIYSALKALKIQSPDSKIVLFSPRGKKFNQKLAHQYSKLKRIVMICGRYEGIDERVNKLVDEKVSVGDYVLMGGEVPAMTVIESVSRLIPGVLGHSELLEERMPKQKGRSSRAFTEYPQYTRPETFSPRLIGGQAKKGESWPVPKVLLQGHHQKIKIWRQKHQKIIF
ncbi:MAG: tRNA (guanosine(37)-N1)-methyltransferase TrmD [bacterium]|nr:tRNA (guanosine(37)-N1)-methyltransferase TrmD [bacterium]